MNRSHSDRENDAPSLGDVIAGRLSRRAALHGMLAAVSAPPLARVLRAGGDGAPTAPRGRDASTLTFAEIDKTIRADHRVAPGHRADVLIRWGDPVLDGAPPFDPHALRAPAQAMQFGFNNDFVGFLPLPARDGEEERGLLCVNHEYTDPYLMWSGVTPRTRRDLSRERCLVEMMAHGHSVVEIVRIGGRWRTRPGGPYARRLTAHGPIMRISGPAAGHRRMRTRDDHVGRYVRGTLNNCSGGMTPWGTVLVAEENFHKYFDGDPGEGPEAESRRRYLILPKLVEYGWAAHFDRFRTDVEPNEPNRFGWFVELDPRDPESEPVKRTALGRFKHEGASVVRAPDGRIVVYSGDDEANEYVYRFVTRRRFDPRFPERGRDLLDDGTLSVARFDADGTMRWLPLVFGTGPLTPANGFHDQGDVVIDARRAADLLGATPMDRPEDIEANPITGTVLVMLTNNPKRDDHHVDAANPRPRNRFGHVVELVPPGGRGADADHAADAFAWNVLLLAGDPANPEHDARYHPGVSKHGWLACPDNAAIDRRGRLWIATDQGDMQSENGISDGIYATDVDGEGRALTKLFYTVPTGAEMCGPCFTPECTTLFVAVQHPADDPGSTFDAPTTRWPDFRDDMPPRPSVVAIRREDGGEIGS